MAIHPHTYLEADGHSSPYLSRRRWTLILIWGSLSLLTSVIRKVCACFPGSVLRAVTPFPRDPRGSEGIRRASPKLTGFKWQFGVWTPKKINKFQDFYMNFDPGRGQKSKFQKKSWSPNVPKVIQKCSKSLEIGSGDPGIRSPKDVARFLMKNWFWRRSKIIFS